MGMTASPRGGGKGRHYQDIKDSRKQEKPYERSEPSFSPSESPSLVVIKCDGVTGKHGWQKIYILLNLYLLMLII